MKLKVETQYRIDDDEFDLLRDLIKQLTGISLSDQKKMLVVARLSKRLRTLGLSSFIDYYNLIIDGEDGYHEIDHLINRITTNKTDFYRENHHFEFLKNVLLPQICEEGSATGDRTLRIWSAGCSSGEEPYTLAITLKEFFKGKPGWNIKIFATDLDTEILERARNGIYNEQVVAPVPPECLRAYFKKGVGANDGLYMVKDVIKSMITFRRHNLVNERLSIKRPFDMIFCRNVIIYFDEAVKNKVIYQHFYDVLRSGGHLFLGHSESLMNNNDKFKLVSNSTYRKIDG